MSTSVPLHRTPHQTYTPTAPALHGLSHEQADGVACAVCALPFRPGDRSIPIGYSTDGAQVFACADTCRLLTVGGAR